MQMFRQGHGGKIASNTGVFSEQEKLQNYTEQFTVQQVSNIVEALPGR
jgi:hypothetical protein